MMMMMMMMMVITIYIFINQRTEHIFKSMLILMFGMFMRRTITQRPHINSARQNVYFPLIIPNH